MRVSACGRRGKRGKEYLLDPLRGGSCDISALTFSVQACLVNKRLIHNYSMGLFSSRMRRSFNTDWKTPIPEKPPREKQSRKHCEGCCLFGYFLWLCCWNVRVMNLKSRIEYYIIGER